MNSSQLHRPTPDQVIAMSVRGWAWSDEICQFICFGGLDRQGCPIINLRVGAWEADVWVAHYGVPGIGYERLTRYATPMAAAAEAEGWLQQVLSPMRLPWLTMVVGGAGTP